MFYKSTYGHLNPNADKKKMLQFPPSFCEPVAVSSKSRSQTVWKLDFEADLRVCVLNLKD